MALGGQLYVNMSDDSRFAENMEDLCGMIALHKAECSS
jgi:hypothetical protein